MSWRYRTGWIVALACGLLLLAWWTATHHRFVRNTKAQAEARDPNPLRLHQGYDASGQPTRVFVGVAISGGGSRAANFAGAVLAELDRLGVLGSVNALSSVSGGSLTASHFALHGFDGSGSVREGERLEPFWQATKDRLSTDFLSAWTMRIVRPDWLWLSTFGNATRTDAMAEVFDETFLGRQSLGDLARDAPKLLVNATAINDIETVGPQDDCMNRGTDAPAVRWESLSLDAGFLINCLGSQPESLRLSTAVAASATFPGVFNTVSLQRFPRAPNDPPAHLHLIDGGPSDNLGIEGLLRVLRDVRASACLLIVIDAFAAGDHDLRMMFDDVRGAKDRVIDFNFLDSIDAMLARRRYDTLQRLGLTPARIEERFGGMLELPDFPIPGQKFRIVQPRTTFLEAVPVGRMMGKESEPDELACAVWLVSLHNLKSLLLGRFVKEGRVEVAISRASVAEHQISKWNWSRRPEVQHRIRVSQVAERLATSFRLSGPEGCSAKQLSDIVWEAGRLSVEDDFEARERVCAWLDSHGLPVGDRCRQPPPVQPRDVPRIDFLAVPGFSDVFRVYCGGG